MEQGLKDWIRYRVREDSEISKFENPGYTQVGPEKGWFCMLIFNFLHCIVHVTWSGKYLLTPTQMCRGYVDIFINNPKC